MRNAVDSVSTARFLALLCLLAATPMLRGESGLSVESTVAFATACARCHEGECSGRMSFHLPPEAADQHILRHGGELAADLVRELIEQVRHMKEACAYYPLPFALARDRSWGPETLGRLRSPSGDTYFLPLGTLAAGPHRIRLQGLGSKARPCVELIDAAFDFIDPSMLDPAPSGWDLRFCTEGSGEVFLRLKAPGPIGLTGVEMVIDDRPVH